jgi:hypothetical protein
MRPSASSSFRCFKALTCLAAGLMDFACSANCSMATYFGPKDIPRSTISSGRGLAKGSVLALQDLARGPVLAPVRQGVVGFASGGLHSTVSVHGSDTSLPQRPEQTPSQGRYEDSLSTSAGRDTQTSHGIPSTEISIRPGRSDVDLSGREEQARDVHQRYWRRIQHLRISGPEDGITMNPESERNLCAFITSLSPAIRGPLY